MNPFESARIGAVDLREELAESKVDLSLGGYALVKGLVQRWTSVCAGSNRAFPS